MKPQNQYEEGKKNYGDKYVIDFDYIIEDNGLRFTVDLSHPNTREEFEEIMEVYEDKGSIAAEIIFFEHIFPNSDLDMLSEHHKDLLQWLYSGDVIVLGVPTDIEDCIEYDNRDNRCEDVKRMRFFYYNPYMIRSFLIDLRDKGEAYWTEHKAFG